MKFSLIIPVAPERNAEIINSINKLDYDKNRIEIIVERGRNPSENRNNGVKKAKNEVLVFLDDDAVIDSDYLNNIEKFLEKNKDIDIVGGPQLTPKDEKGFAKISGYALSSKFGSWKISDRYCKNGELLNADETCITSANLVCKKKVFNKIEFDLNLFPGEDPKFISDAKKNGFKIAYSPEIIVYHRRRASVNGMIKQIFNYGKVRPLKEKFSETLKMPFFFIPSLFLIYLILLIVLMVMKYSRFFVFLPFILYVILALIFSVHDSFKNKDYKAVIFLPFIYLIIHVSYGAGMIYGYFKKLF